MVMLRVVYVLIITRLQQFMVIDKFSMTYLSVVYFRVREDSPAKRANREIQVSW